MSECVLHEQGTVLCIIHYAPLTVCLQLVPMVVAIDKVYCSMSSTKQHCNYCCGDCCCDYSLTEVYPPPYYPLSKGHWNFHEYVLSSSSYDDDS